MRRFFTRIALVAIVAIAINSAASAQWTLVKGDNLLSGAIGFGGFYSYSHGSRMPVISLYYENCVVDNLWDENSSIGVGGMLAHTSYSWKGDTGFKTSNTVLGVRGALHYQFVDKLDTYAGLFLGYDIVSWKWNNPSYPGTNDASSSFSNSFFLGARYYFSDTWAAFGELGVGLAPLNLGVTYKF